MSQVGNVAVVRDFYVAFNRGELSEMVACLTEDFVLLPPAYAVDGIAHSGHEAFMPGSSGWVSFGAASS